MRNEYWIRLTYEEIESLIILLDQCRAEGYMHSDDPANHILDKLTDYQVMRNKQYDKK